MELLDRCGVADAEQALGEAARVEVIWNTPRKLCQRRMSPNGEHECRGESLGIVVIVIQINLEAPERWIVVDQGGDNMVTDGIVAAVAFAKIFVIENQLLEGGEIQQAQCIDVLCDDGQRPDPGFVFAEGGEAVFGEGHGREELDVEVGLEDGSPLPADPPAGLDVVQGEA